jgi:hypothetical protein
MLKGILAFVVQQTMQNILRKQITLHDESKIFIDPLCTTWKEFRPTNAIAH